MKPFEYVEKRKDGDKIYVNDEYQVDVKELVGGWKWLSIKRRDKDVIHDWRILQEIKNKIAGDEYEAVELYPAESRLVDTSNQFHLFVMPEGEKFPFGYGDRMIVKGHDDRNFSGKRMGGSRQRDFENEPEDALTIEEVKELAKKDGLYEQMEAEDESNSSN